MKQEKLTFAIDRAKLEWKKYVKAKREKSKIEHKKADKIAILEQWIEDLWKNEDILIKDL